MTIISVVIGCAFVAGAEWFFRANHKYRWLRPLSQSQLIYRPGPDPSPARATLASLDLGYVEKLQPADSIALEDARQDQRERPDELELSGCDSGGKPFDSRWSWPFPRCHLHVRQRMKKSRKVIVDVVYGVDEYGRRIVPKTNLHANRNLIFMGCSFTLGDGVNDEETFPAQIAPRVPNYHVMNFGMNGYAENNWLHVLRENDVRSQTPNSMGGTLVFTHIDDHFRRIMGSLQWVERSQNVIDPLFELDSQGRVIERGTFENDRPFWTWLYRTLAPLELLKYFSVDFPLNGRSEVELMVALLKEIKKTAFERLGVDHFVFAIFPQGSRDLVFLIQRLKEENIDYFDYSSINASKILKQNDLISGNYHPTPTFYRLYADLLYADLKGRGYLQP